MDFQRGLADAGDGAGVRAVRAGPAVRRSRESRRVAVRLRVAGGPRAPGAGLVEGGIAPGASRRGLGRVRHSGDLDDAIPVERHAERGAWRLPAFCGAALGVSAGVATAQALLDVCFLGPSLPG